MTKISEAKLFCTGRGCWTVTSPIGITRSMKSLSQAALHLWISPQLIGTKCTPIYRSVAMTTGHSKNWQLVWSHCFVACIHVCTSSLCKFLDRCSYRSCVCFVNITVCRRLLHTGKVQISRGALVPLTVVQRTKHPPQPPGLLKITLLSVHAGYIVLTRSSESATGRRRHQREKTSDVT